MSGLKQSIKPGVVFGNQVTELLDHARNNGYAIPAINVTGTQSVNAALEAANKLNSPVIIQLSHGGAGFFIGKGSPLEKMQQSIQGAIAAATYVNQVAEHYQVPVILHTDHANLPLLPWIDGMLAASKEHMSITGNPLFSSHMIDLSAEPLQKNLDICCNYLREMAEMDMTLEIELGCTGGEEDGIDNSHLDNSMLYTQPEDVALAWKQLSAISPRFTIAASFGNVHGVYKPGNVQLTPEILKRSQEHVAEEFSLSDKPVNFVFHGGSGSELDDIHRAIDYGAVKMNIDTDTQWAMWDGVNRYQQENKGYLQSQIGNPEGNDKPNKKYYDPRVWLREGETSMVKRLEQAFADLKCVNRYA
ncbi:class II fructose-bisphosphate aldolase [Thalassotalea sp. PS06]|uniref:class II fructose-bisphosphate aldolase n=1 Tax=Thalassotalea sp. PS06 TaxID=2594005 RepID=UPI001163090B|nr:class II fructose-bisphosphate aldolase [Thalassotalea sp. PS06]QDO99903.1 class II fructose-bisphosphate aldolase [Thalassotalea sp. PS06]